MAFFEELGKKAQAFAEVATEKAKAAAEVASEKAKDATDTAKINMEIMSTQREIEKNYKAIGQWFVSEFEGEIPDAVKDVVAAVVAAKEKIAALEASKPKKDAAPREEHVDVKVCPVCGVAADSKFCPECGAPMGE